MITPRHKTNPPTFKVEIKLWKNVFTKFRGKQQKQNKSQCFSSVRNKSFKPMMFSKLGAELVFGGKKLWEISLTRLTYTVVILIITYLKNNNLLSKFLVSFFSFLFFSSMVKFQIVVLSIFFVLLCPVWIPLFLFSICLHSIRYSVLAGIELTTNQLWVWSLSTFQYQSP